LSYAKTSFVLHALKIAHEVQLALRPHLRADALASTTSHPAFVTTRDRPSCRNGMARVKALIWGPRELDFACRANLSQGDGQWVAGGRYL
jgi:hypothetical protein